MQNEIPSLQAEVKDKRVVKDGEPGRGDFLPTLIVWLLLLVAGTQPHIFEVIRPPLFIALAMLIIAMVAARDATKRLKRRVDALARLLENKNLL